MKRVDPAPAYASLVATGIVLPGGILLVRVYGGVHWFYENPSFLNLIQSLSAFLALATGIVLFIAGVCAPEDMEHGKRRYLPWVAAGLLAMGIIGMFGSSFVRVDDRTLLLDLGVQWFGSFFCVLSWLPDRIGHDRRVRYWAPIVAIVASVAFAAYVFLLQPQVPPFVVSAYFTRQYVLLKAVGGALFLLSALQFMLQFRNSRRSSDLIFAHLLLLLGAADLVLEQFYLWGPIWWTWNGIQMAAFGISFVYAFTLYARGEAALQRSERKVQALAKDLTRANQELERSNRELQNFAHLASHDLQEPLRMMRSFLELLARKYSTELDPQAKEYIQYAIDGSKRMKALIDGLLQYARVSKQPLNVEVVDMSKIVGDALLDLQLPIAETKATILFENLPSVFGDPLQLRRLFENLIQNALKYRANCPPVIAIDYKDEDSLWRFEVSDNGQGISAEAQANIFELFARGGRTSEDGTGIGLAACKSIVERHGGEIGVRSESQGGSVFYFTLPKREPAAGEKT